MVANLRDLPFLTGHKSVSEMTDEELREHLRVCRVSRRTTKTTDKKLSEKEPKTRTRPAKKERSLDDLAENLSEEALLALIAKLGG